MGYPTPQAVVEGWMNSEGHRANILNSAYTRSASATSPTATTGPSCLSADFDKNIDRRQKAAVFHVGALIDACGTARYASREIGFTIAEDGAQKRRHYSARSP
jgi:hypothetical protein